MSELRFSVRNRDGSIIKSDKQYYHDGTNEVLTWHGSNRDEVFEALRELPVYTRGKLKADLMCRFLPQKELGHYDDFGIDLVMTEEIYNEIKKRIYYNEYTTECMTYECRLIDGQKLPFLILRTETIEFNTVAFFKMCEYELCKDLKHFYRMEALEEVTKLYDWLYAFKNGLKFKIDIERWGHDNERESVYVQVEGFGDKRRICELSYVQKKTINLGSAKSTIITMCKSIVETEKDNNKLIQDLIGECKM